VTASSQRYVIVVGVDYSETSSLALREALRSASTCAPCNVHVVHVQPASDDLFESTTEPAAADASLNLTLEHLQAVVRTEVTRFEERLPRPMAKPFGLVCHVRSGSPDVELCALAQDVSADLIVVGTRGQTGIVRALLGSVAQTVTMKACCPVLLVRPKQPNPAKTHHRSARELDGDEIQVVELEAT